MQRISQRLAAAICMTIAFHVHAQGWLVYDQQSATAPEIINYDTFDIYKQPLYESFVPTLSSIGFVQLEISDYMDTNTSGARLLVALYSGSPGSYTLIGNTPVVYLPPDFDNDQLTFSGVTNFYFSSPVTLTPGKTYYISPVELTGDHVWSVAVASETYSNGGLSGFDGNALWFREGVVATPEPTDLELWTTGGLLALGIFGARKLRSQKEQQR